MSEIEEKYEENKEKDKIIMAYCIKCKLETRHKIVASYDHRGSEFDRYEHWSIEWYASHQIIQCQGCMSSSFREVSSFSEDIRQIGPNEFEPYERIALYPKRLNNTISIKDFWEVPINLRRIYRETIDSFNNDSFTLCAAGLRAIVEGLCAELGVSDGPKEITKSDGSKEVKRSSRLEGKIAGLHEKGFLTKHNTDILHEHRYLGNDALHELSLPSREELELAIDIIEHAFDSIFQIPHKGKDLAAKRERRNKET